MSRVTLTRLVCNVRVTVWAHRGTWWPPLAWTTRESPIQGISCWSFPPRSARGSSPCPRGGWEWTCADDWPSSLRWGEWRWRGQPECLPRRSSPAPGSVRYSNKSKKNINKAKSLLDAVEMPTQPMGMKHACNSQWEGLSFGEWVSLPARELLTHFKTRDATTSKISYCY